MQRRYDIIQGYLDRSGSGPDLGLRTCTVQVNLDYSSETDMIRKFRASLALQPVRNFRSKILFLWTQKQFFVSLFCYILIKQIATALFANSPFSNGKPNGFLSIRSLVYTLLFDVGAHYSFLVLVLLIF